MSWRDGLTDKECFESYVKSLDMRERIDYDIDQVILEEWENEYYLDSINTITLFYPRVKSVFDA